MNAFFIPLLGILLCENPGKQSYRLQKNRKENRCLKKNFVAAGESEAAAGESEAAAGESEAAAGESEAAAGDKDKTEAKSPEVLDVSR